MKTKVTEPKISSVKKQKGKNSYDFLNYNDNKTFDFVGLYKTAAETTKILEKDKIKEPQANANNMNNNTKRERPSSKRAKKHKQELVKVSHININASSLNSSVGARPQVNSEATPSSSNTDQVGNVKSIMKNSSFTDPSVDSARSTKSSGKSKKRNKSVSFMLDDNEEVVIKRTKSNDSVITTKNDEKVIEHGKNKKKHQKKFKKSEQSEKENTTTNINKGKMDVNSVSASSKIHKAAKTKVKNTTESETASTSEEVDKQIQEKKKKFKKSKKQNPDVNPDETETNKEVAASESVNSMATSESKSKKLKKKKLKKSASLDTEDETGEPNAKSRKTEFEKPDIVEDLENLSIGDNAHTLTNLLDEMTVVDKNKKKKHKVSKKSKEQNKEVTDQLEVKEKEKVKWNKRKWNKDKKGVLDDDELVNTVVVENLPLNIMLNYKKLLTEHFVKYGLIKSIGLAEVYPTEESKPVFTTTIHFYSDGAAKQALELNNTEFEGSRIRVKHPLPRTATTIVVRSYGELTDQNISSAFLGAGKIRSIRHLVKGKKSMATSFVEFDGPEAVKYALTKIAGTKIGGKKIHVAKYEPRQKKKTKEQKNDGDSAAEADSEDSND